MRISSRLPAMPLRSSGTSSRPLLVMLLLLRVTSAQDPQQLARRLRNVLDHHHAGAACFVSDRTGLPRAFSKG
ncbi:hypothetical protein [Stutzerimonas stutzeri]|uniref:hypothetical protein n=1 Tax=Stutzerimonas stutzeri TaxID=316 RepID=UPI00210B82FF|nr:hypothetical protein [Stutzerimonas stutzeri]MCQ4321634.1 hypothetical protein [Stutzerimonas stutzeri]